MIHMREKDHYYLDSIRISFKFHSLIAFRTFQYPLVVRVRIIKRISCESIFVEMVVGLAILAAFSINKRNRLRLFLESIYCINSILSNANMFHQ